MKSGKTKKRFECLKCSAERTDPLEKCNACGNPEPLQEVSDIKPIPTKPSSSTPSRHEPRTPRPPVSPPPRPEPRTARPPVAPPLHPSHPPDKSRSIAYSFGRTLADSVKQFNLWLRSLKLGPRIEKLRAYIDAGIDASIKKVAYFVGVGIISSS